MRTDGSPAYNEGWQDCIKERVQPLLRDRERVDEYLERLESQGIIIDWKWLNAHYPPKEFH